jgi:PAS domain S-box-containing protein
MAESRADTTRDDAAVAAVEGSLERALRESEQRYRALVEMSPNGIVVHRDDRFLYANTAALALYGAATFDDLRQHGVLELIHRDDRAEIAERIARVTAGDSSPRRELRLRRIDGQEVFIEASAAPVEYQGRLAIQVVLLDIGERKRAERALRQSEERYRLLFETMFQGVVHQDATGTIISMNPAAERILGKSREEFLGSNSVREERGTLHLDGSPFPGLEHPSMVALRTGEAQRDVGMGVYNPREQAYRWISISAVPLFRPGEAGPYQVYTLFHDITEQRLQDEARRQAEAAVCDALAAERRARAEAEAANRLKDEFLSTVSHELRTPLNAIVGWASMLQQKVLAPVDEARARDAIIRNARRQAQLVDDLLDVSRIMAGKLRLESAHVEIEPVIRAAIEAVIPSARDRSISITTALDPRGALVYGDATRLQQIAWNLLSNAVKFTPEGGTIDVSLLRRGRQIEIRVRDSGTGIDPDFLPHVFERFRQADSTITRSSGGLGLGLAIVRHLAELHGGAVAAASDGPGRGATFTVTLPVASDLAVPGGARATPPADQTAPGDAPRLDGLRVVAVDDEADAREMIATTLACRGARVAIASSAAEAVECIRATRPHLVLVDIAMPVEDGYAFLARLRALDAGRYAEVPAIALTAYARPEDAARARAAGFQLHLSKPVEPVALARAVRSLCWSSSGSPGGEAPP